MTHDELKALHEIDFLYEKEQIESALSDDENNLVAKAIGFCVCTSKEDQTLDVYLNEICIDSELREYLHHTMSDRWDSVDAFRHELNIGNVRAYVLFDDSHDSVYECDETPDSISQLAISLLKIGKDDLVVDFCAGTGSFTRYLLETADVSSVYASEISDNRRILFKLRAYLIGSNIRISDDDLIKTKYSGKFEKVFCDYPVGIPLSKQKDIQNSDLVAYLESNVSKLRRMTSSEWIYNLAIINSLSDTGKAIVLMTPNAMWGFSDIFVRKFFVENGYIESVIYLPYRLYRYTVIQMVMVVLSKHNKHIKFVDARSEFEQSVRTNTLSPDNINHIMQYINGDSEKMIEVSADSIDSEKYSLSYDFYDKARSKAESKHLIDYTKKIIRGTQMSAAKTDSLISSTPTGVKLLKIGDVIDDRIPDTLPYITANQKRLDKYIAEPGDVLLSKNIEAFKIVYIENTADKILVNSNFYIIRVDPTKLNPIYLMVYLKSNACRELLLSKCSMSGYSRIVTIGALSALQIPFIPMDQQNEIANKYLDLYHRKRTIQDELSAIDAEMQNLI